MAHSWHARRALPAFGLAVLLVAAQAATVAASAGSVARSAAAAAEARVDKGLEKALADGTAERFVVEFGARTDLKGANKIKDRTKKGAFVLEALRTTARGSQAAAIALVKKTKGARAQSFWLGNELLVHGDVALARKLAALPGVTTVRAEKTYPLVKPVPAAAILALAPEWGVDKVGAPGVWAEGITGQGVVVGSVDTGVDYTHEALVEHYRGNNHDGTFTHDYNWWDPTGICGGTPCDNAGHGTHTMGTMVGGDLDGPLPDVGVAPGAEWISAKGCEDFGCTEGSLLSAGQFILAPTDLAGNNADPSKRPDVVNNSWGNDNPDDHFYQATVEAWRAAGIIPVFSAGNNGSGCSTAGSPGNAAEVISAGATDVNDQIADFSSRGPSPSGKISPNVSAPGVDVVSSLPGGGYGGNSGTSMAAPHVTGTIALMISARPELASNFDAILDSLGRTAVDRPDGQCGSPDPSDNDPNYVYGEGRIDAKAAVDLVKTGGTLVGTVSDAATSDPIGAARISATGGDRTFSTTTAPDGTYSLFLAAGDYVVTAVAFGYQGDVAPLVTIVTDEETTQNFALTALPRFTVTGHVRASEDGSAIADASVVALGTPVPAATTDAAGAYSLVLPIGSYTLQASSGGCTESATAEISSNGDDLVQDFSLFRKLDDFGHGCRRIALDWVDASGQTGLYGDEFAGRLRLPFDFPFYGESYAAVFLSDNGYLNFLKAEQYNAFPVGIPNSGPPNAAIYALWQDLYLDDGSEIDIETLGSAPDRTFVIEYSGIKSFSGSARVSFEIKLHEDGTIDLLYGDNPANPGDGSKAGIGIENATGTDALQFSLFQALLAPNEAWRYEIVPSGLVHGTVTDANDGLPISGAHVTATPGGRTATTGADGTYSLRLRPGAYDVAASADNYVTSSTALTVSDGSDDVRDFSLAAAVGSVEPTTIAETVDFGETTTAHVSLSNSGSAPLVWQAKERDLGTTPGTFPTVSSSVLTYRPGWHRPIVRGALPDLSDVLETLPPSSLQPIIDDPSGDSNGPIDVTQIRGGSDGQAVVAMSIDFAAGTPMDQAVGEIYVDVDQNPNTGIPAQFLAGLPTQDVGAEYLIGLFQVHDPEPIVYAIDLNTFDLSGVGPASVVGNTISFELPLAALGGDDGNMDVDFALGDFFQPLDWAPDIGHGTIVPFSDVPWLSESPESGTTDVGESTDVTLTLGTPGMAPGTYHALVVFVTNAPKQTQIPVDVTLTVAMPDAFGAVGGTVTDAHSGDPLAGASVVVHTTWQGNPLDLATTTAGDGTWQVVGPEGTWTADVTADGYVPASLDVTIVRGTVTGGADVALHKDQPHAVVEGGPITAVLTPDRTAHATIVVSNPGGHRDLTFSVGEVDLGATTESAAAAAAARASAAKRVAPTGAAANARTTRGLFGPVVGGATPAATGDVLASWPTGLNVPWGVGFSGDVWLSDAFANGDLCGFSDACHATEFAVDGSLTGRGFDEPWVEAFPGDLAWDAGRGLLWEVNVGGDNGIYGLDPADGSVEAVITGSPWTNTSQRGLAYDPANDVFYIGGWNEGIVYRVAGPSHPTPGETLGQCAPDAPEISGLAWNASFGMLWEATNSETDSIFLLDPTTCETQNAIGHPDGGGFSGAGLETDAVGNLWTVGQNSGNAYLIESGLPNFSDVSWLSVSPTDGTIAPDGSTDLDVTIDTTGLAPGVYRAIIVIQTNDPDHSVVQVPVQLVVPAYQQGVNAGGGAYVDAGGNLWAADRAWTSGGFGYLGASSSRSTTAAISGTDEDGLYQDLRTGMTGYRFDVPAGTYQVDLAFAELVAKKTGARVFSISIEGQTVIADLDVFAAAGGRNAALLRTFQVDVSDGHLDIGFTAQRGDAPIINGILVTEVPPGS